LAGVTSVSPNWVQISSLFVQPLPLFFSLLPTLHKI